MVEESVLLGLLDLEDDGITFLWNTRILSPPS
jgi:hypothetical protein